jgi:hypothetical protein
MRRLRPEAQLERAFPYRYALDDMVHPGPQILLTRGDGCELFIHKAQGMAVALNPS